MGIFSINEAVGIKVDYLYSTALSNYYSKQHCKDNPLSTAQLHVVGPTDSIGRCQRQAIIHFLDGSLNYTVRPVTKILVWGTKIAGKLVPRTVFLPNILVLARNNGSTWSEHKSIAGATSRVQFRAEESVKYQNRGT